MNLDDGETFQTHQIKRVKTRVNQKMNSHVTQSDAYG